jgi:hypothetical protein
MIRASAWREQDAVGRLDAWSSRPQQSASVKIGRKRCGLADGATSPAETAAAATAATAASPAASAAAATATAAAPTAAATAPSEFFAELGFRVFLVEDVECRQAHVGDFFLTEKDFMTR